MCCCVNVQIGVGVGGGKTSGMEYVFMLCIMHDFILILTPLGDTLQVTCLCP